MKKLVGILIMFILAISTVYCQDQGQIEIQNVQTLQNVQTQQPPIDFSNNEQMDPQFASMRRTACLVLSRYHSNTQKEQIEQIVKSLNPDDQQKYINKIYAVAVEKCEDKITPSEVNELFVQNPNFEPSHLFHNFDDMNYAEVTDFQSFTPNQKNIVKYMKEFDQNMQVKRQQKQAEKQELEGAQKMDLKFFGFSFHEVSDTVKLIYLGIFILIIVGALYYGFSKLDTDKNKKTSSKRRKASPKKQ